MAQPDVKVRISAVDETKAAFQSVARGAQGLKNAIFSVQGAIAGVAGGAVISGLVKTNAEFQRLQASLQTFTGSAAAASKKFEELQTFAAKTPFSLQEIVQGFNILKARGLDPSITSFNAFGNIASGTGKSLNQLTEALADAAVGEFERLKEFGIKANKEGDRIKFTFGGVATTVGNNSEEILGYLEQLGNVQFAGAMERQAQTLDGAFSNFGDAVDALAKTIGESGLNDFIVNVTRSLTGMIQRLNEATKAGVNLGQMFQQVFGSDDVNERLAKIRKEIEWFESPMRRGLLNSEAGREEYRQLLALEAELLSQRQKASGGAPTGGRGGFGGVRAMVVTPRVEEVKEDPVKKLAKSMEKTAPAIKTYADEINESVAGIISQTAVVRAQEYTDKLKALNDLLIAGLDPKIYDQAVAALSGMTAQVGVAQEAVDDFKLTAKSDFDELKDAVNGWGREFTNTVTNMVMTGKGSFRDLANSIISDLIRIQIQKRITDPLVKMGTGFLDSIFGGTAPTPAVPSADGGGFTGLGARAGGIDGKGGFMAMLHPNETVVDHTKGQSMGGVVVNQTINVTTGVQQTVRAEILTLMPQIANAAKSAVADAKLRGGSYAAALR